MTLGHKSARLILAGAILTTAGCASQQPRPPMANSANEILPTHNRAQLLAAARQYEKEGRPDLAVKYYRQVLALEPDNLEASDGLHYVQSGKPRTDANYQDIIATAQPKSRPRLRTGEEFARSTSVIDERTAQLIANAAARATAEAISNAAANATAEYLAATRASLPASAGSTQSPAPVPVALPANLAEARTSALAENRTSAKSPESPTEHTPRATAASPVSRTIDTEVVNLHVVTVVGDEQSTGITAAAAKSSADVLAAPSPSPASNDRSETSAWQATSLTRLCQDANAAVLREVARLDSHDPEVRKEGLRGLAQLGPDASSATLAVRMLVHDRDELVRAHAAWVLWELTGDCDSPVATLTEMLSSQNREAVEFAAYTLSGIGSCATPALSVLRRLAESDDQSIQLHAAEALAQIAAESDRQAATETLILLTAQPSSEIRTLALLALGEVADVPTPSVTTAMMSALHDSDPAVRSAAALALGGFGPAASNAIEQLEFVASSDQAEVKQAAAAALDCIRRAD